MLGKELVKQAQRNGWKLDRIAGSHHIMIKDDKTVSIPVHTKDIPKGTLNKLLKQLGFK